MKKLFVGFLVGMIVALAFPVMAEYNESSDQEQDQTQDQISSTNVDAREDDRVYRGSFSASIPEGNEGPAIFTPWGGVGVSKMSRVTELLMMAEVVKENSPEHLWIIEQLKDEIGESCRWLGFGPKGWQFPFLLGLDCWPDLRVWED